MTQSEKTGFIVACGISTSYKANQEDWRRPIRSNKVKNIAFPFFYWDASFVETVLREVQMYAATRLDYLDSIIILKIIIHFIEIVIPISRDIINKYIFYEPEPNLREIRISGFGSYFSTLYVTAFSITFYMTQHLKIPT